MSAFEVDQRTAAGHAGPGRRRIRSRLRAAADRPLFLAQVCSSASGALGIVLAAAFMDTGRFAVFSLLSLAAVTLAGLVRSFLFQPALIRFRHDKHALVPFRYALPGALAAGVLLAAAALLFDPGASWLVLVLAVSGAFPVLHDWLRFRAMAVDRRWDVAISDAIRLVLVVASLFMLLAAAEPVLYQAYLGLSLVVPTLYLRLRLPRLGSFTPLGSYLRPASLQLADFAIGQFNSTIPLMVLGGFGASALIGGVRLAQTLLGPLNLVFAARSINLIADGASSQAHAGNDALIGHGRKLARLQGALALAWVLPLVVFVWLTQFELAGVRNGPLLVGLLLVGASIVGSGWSGIHAVVLRLLGRQGTVTACRALLVTVTLGSFALGYHFGGVDLSLLLGFLAAAVASPLVFGVPSQLIYRSQSRRQDLAAPSPAEPAEGASVRSSA
ncbi:hypothetical protein ACFQ36_08455 [Arthrobacter sp. GCM10027362]|uniref:hypothetical protein n=1 Tax=Arthrobacter sp. GCM10027362 TaxID=3273379 RepID=UPI0036385D77